MAISILNNPASLAAQNQLGVTNMNLQKALYQLSSGSRINTGADDAAGLAVADGLAANITALTQSARNASDGVGKLQVADGALAQVTTLLNRAITLATESANGTLSDTQRAPLQSEFASIATEINRIGATTNFNGQQVFQNVSVNTQAGATGGLNASTTLGGTPMTDISTSGSQGTPLLGTAALASGTAATWVSTSALLTRATSIANETVTISLTNPGTGASSSYIYHATASGAGSTVGDLLDAINNASNAGTLTATGPVGAGTAALTITANGSAVSLSESGGTGIGGGAQGVAGQAANFTIGTANPYTYTTYDFNKVSDLMNAINADGRYTAAIPGSTGKLTIGYGTVQEPPDGNTAAAVTTTINGASSNWAVFGAFSSAGAGKTFTIQASGAAQATSFVDEGNLTVRALITDIQNMGLSAQLDNNGHLVVGDPNNPNNAPTVTGTMTTGGVLGTFAAGSQQSVGAATDIYLTDDSANAANSIAVVFGALSSSSMNGASIASDNLSTQSAAQSALADISSAINDVAALRGTLGASVNRLQSATNVINNNIQNLTAAQDNIRAADIPSTVASMAKYPVVF